MRVPVQKDKKFIGTPDLVPGSMSNDRNRVESLYKFSFSYFTIFRDEVGTLSPAHSLFSFIPSSTLLNENFPLDNYCTLKATFCWLYLENNNKNKNNTQYGKM